MKKINIVLIAMVSIIAWACVPVGGDPLPPNTPIVNPTTGAILTRPYNKVCFLMTHNAMNNSDRGYSIPNQTHSVGKQLHNGVRGLMIDTYDGPDGKALTYHGVSTMGNQPLVDVLKEVYTFLANNQNEIVTIIFENNGSNAQLIAAIEESGLTNFAYVHNGTWKTLQQMINSNQRLVMFAEQDKTPSANYLKHAWTYVFDTKYSFTSVPQFDCEVNRGTYSENNLFLVNHWLSSVVGLPDRKFAFNANKKQTIQDRLQNCNNTRDHFINFLGVDFYEVGDALAVVDSINQNYTP